MPELVTDLIGLSVIKRITRTCQHCGKQWRAYPSSRDKTKYCSSICYHASISGIPIKPKEVQGAVARACERCGTEFLVGGANHPTKDVRFCGRVCGKKAFWEAHKAAGTDISRPDMKGIPKPGRWIEPEQKACTWCQTPFAVGGSGRSRNRTFCSRSCARRSMWADRASGAVAQLPISHTQAVTMRKEDAMWFAGVFDGEGCISFPHKNPNWKVSASLAVTNTNYALLEKLIAVTGTGRITTRGRQDKDHHAPCWTWNCNGANARTVLDQIFPYLIVKKPAAEYALLGDNAVPPIAPRNMHKATIAGPNPEATPKPAASPLERTDDGLRPGSLQRPLDL